MREHKPKAEVQTETEQRSKGPKPARLPAEVLDGPKQMAGKDGGQKQMGGQWAEQQKKGMEKQEAAQVAVERHPALSDEEQQKLEEDVARDTAEEEEEAGEDRTPDRIIGQVAHADGKMQTGGAGEPQTTLMEPEKQGGISGP